MTKTTETCLMPIAINHPTKTKLQVAARNIKRSKRLPSLPSMYVRIYARNLDNAPQTRCTILDQKMSSAGTVCSYVQQETSPQHLICYLDKKT